MQKRISFILIFIIPFTWMNGSFAQHADSLKKELPEVIVTATRTAKNPDSIGRSVTVINENEIQKLQPNDLGQLLSVQQGVSIIGSGQNPGMTQTIFMRGANSNHTLITIDGVRISDPSSVNNAIDLVEIPLSGFSQIEIVRGSHSTLFGSGGIGGVINLITSGKQAPGFHAMGSVRGGTFGSNTFLLEENLDLNYSFRSGFYSNLDFYNNKVNGLDATLDTIGSPSAFKSFDEDDFHLLKASAKVGFKNLKWDAFVSFGFTEQKTDFDKTGWKYNNPFGANPLAWYDGDSTKIFTQRNLITYHADHDFSENLSLSFSGGFTKLERTVIDDSSIVDDIGTFDHTYSDAIYEGSNMNHDLQASYSAKHFEILAGAGMLRETMTFKTSFYTNSFFGPLMLTSDLDSFDLSADLYHGFLQAEVSGGIFSEKIASIRMLAGVRFNHHNRFGNLVDYEINPSWQITKGALMYASVSSGFNAPSLYQLYSPEVYYASDITRGNPLLQPEVSHSIEFGFRQRVTDYFEFELALYQNKIDQEIEYVYMWDQNVPIDSLGSDFLRDDYRGDTYLNVGLLTSRGVEISFSSKLNKVISLSGNLNLANGKLEYDPSAIDTMHTQGNHIQLYSNGAFPVTAIQTSGLTRRSSTANIILAIQPADQLLIQAMSRWVGPHTDIFYDSNLGPFGALGTFTIEDYVLFDATVRYQFNKYLAASLKVENIFNSGFTEIRGFTTRGRGFYLSVRASL